MIVGLTGGIGSGKSTIAKMFQDLGVPVYNSDVEAKALMENDPKLRADITKLLGEQAYQDGRLNRTYIATRVFGEAQLLQQLNALVHPAVREHFLVWVQEQRHPYVMQETALIFENNMQDFYDQIVLVHAPVTERINRVVLRDGVRAIDVEKRMEHQLPDSTKIKAADFVITNLVLAESRSVVVRIHDQLLQVASSQ